MRHVLSSKHLVFILLLLSCSKARESVSTPETVQPSSQGKIKEIQSVAFSGLDDVWVLLSKKGILHSEDGGNTWKRHELKSTGSLKNLTFIDNKQGWAINEQAQMFRTNDGGQSWEHLTHLDYGQASIIGPVMQIGFVDDSHGWILDPVSIWRTDDGGITWQRIGLPKQEHPFHFQFTDPDTGWVNATGGVIYATKNGGKSWRSNKISPNGGDVRTVFFIEKQFGWAAISPRGSLYVTEDGGDTWQPQFLPVGGAFIKVIHFTNKQEGWAVGFESIEGRDTPFDTRGLVLHTRDGGKVWEVVESLRNNKSYDHIYFADEEHGWLISQDSVFRTNNGGENWVQVISLAGLLH